VQPRYYQREASNAIFDYFIGGGEGHPLVVCPTGGGKTHILGDFVRQILETWDDQHVLIISHSKEILQQDYDTVVKYVPEDFVGLYSAGLNKRQRRQVTVAGVGSIAKRAKLFAKASLILVDEAHRIPPSNVGQYAQVFEALPHAKVVGLTATPFRMGSGYLHEGEGALFDKIIYDINIEELVEQGFLSNLISVDPVNKMSTEGIHTRRGDFVTGELSTQLDREELTQGIVSDLLTYSTKYKHWLLFAIDIQHAENIVRILAEHGVPAACTHSKLNKKQNELAVEGFKSGLYKALVNVEKLTTGFDFPAIDLIALMRPTKSPVLHIQMIGRGLRISEGKDHCLILDFAGNISRLGAINDVTVVDSRSNKKGEAITKTCPECRTICHPSVRVCPSCGTPFEFRESLELNASTAEVIKKKSVKKEKEKIINWHNVTKVTYAKHTSKTLKESLKVTYYCGLRFFHEWVSIGATTRAGYHAKAWWNYRASNGIPAPISVDEAVTRIDELMSPLQILVDETDRYPTIKKHIYE